MLFLAEKAKDLWDKLRRCFCNAVSRRRDKKSGQAAKKMTPWKYEHQMSFILPYLENRKYVQKKIIFFLKFLIKLTIIYLGLQAI